MARTARTPATIPEQTSVARRTGKSSQRLTPGNAKKAVKAVRIAVPVVTPWVGRVASATRAGYERARARRLGVPVDQVGRFTGKGAALHARLAGDLNAVDEVRSRAEGKSAGDKGKQERAAVQEFTDHAASRLAELTTAVRTAERMPASRRRAAHRAVRSELDDLERSLLHHLGVG